MKRYEANQLQLRTINEVARFIMRYADYADLDTFRIPLDIMKSLINGIIPYSELLFLEKEGK